MKTLAILGAGGHGRVVADAAEASGQWDEIFFFDDSWPDRTCNGPWQIVGNTKQLENDAKHYGGIVIAIGINRIRLRLSQEMEFKGGRLAVIVHPHATISRHAKVGKGSVVFAGAVVNIGATVGHACIINTGATVDHDCQLADGVHISPGANLAGTVNVGTCAWIGAGAAVRQQIAIGADVVVGVGAAVVHDQPAGVTVVGNPAKVLRTS
ncbi:hypothetical protein GCM10023144_25200 [Pigmentiphaga soli]|uniref:PglD N-terminal domain-containing protein n=1 Tax=Pigmentiphaga soli TaxID=1007095 RepID=A0ABP8H3X6_9BURK